MKKKTKKTENVKKKNEQNLKQENKTTKQQNKNVYAMYACKVNKSKKKQKAIIVGIIIG